MTETSDSEVAISPGSTSQEPDRRDVPWWRRPRRLRRQLAGTLVVVALMSVVLMAGLNFVAARELLDDGTRDQLVGVGEARARSIDLGIDRVLGNVAALAADLAIVESLDELDQAFSTLEDLELTAEQDSELDRAYQSLVVDPLNELPLERDVTLDDAVPRTNAARYAQYHYTLVDELDGRRDVDDAADGSTYSQTHADWHPFLRNVADIFGFGDLLLTDTEGNIVYSVEKSIDFATNLLEGPHRDTNLADTVLRRLTRVPVGTAVLADMELYVPGGANPVTFASATIRRDREVLGALAVQISVSGLNAITTAGEQWEQVGLSTGESYVVGPDRVLVSESRLWIEDPEKYLDEVDDPELAAFISALGSPVGLQPVETPAVETGLDGRTFEGVTRNYLGKRTFTYATPITARGVEWVVVADIPLSEARAPLYDYLVEVGLVLLIILPVAALIGLWLAGRLTRPIPPVVSAALAVAEGDRDPDIPDLGRDEFGDLARRLRHMAAELARQEAALEEEYENRRRLLLTVLPPRMVEGDDIPSEEAALAQTATVVAVALDHPAGATAPDDTERAELLASALSLAEDLAEDRGLEWVRAAADQYLLLSGVGSSDDAADAGVGFAVGFAAAIDGFAGPEETELDVHIGLSSGPVATGMLESGSLRFAAWGEPVRRALAIAALARADEVLVDETTAASLTEDGWSLAAATDVVDLDGQPMDLFTVESASGDAPDEVAT
jgi:class 3 adenylate cyclase